jgi:hypothetical protein
LGSLAVLAAIAFIAFGLPVIDRSIPSNRPVAADSPFEVGAGTALRPPRGSTVDLSSHATGR